VGGDDDDDDDLFDYEAKSRRSDPETSHAAAASLSPEDVERLEREVATDIRGCGHHGAIWDEIHYRTGIAKASISPRFKPLRIKKQIIAKCDKDGNIEKRTGDSTRGQIVWIAVEYDQFPGVMRKRRGKQRDDDLDDDEREGNFG